MTTLSLVNLQSWIHSLFMDMIDAEPLYSQSVSLSLSAGTALISEQPGQLPRRDSGLVQFLSPWAAVVLGVGGNTNIWKYKHFQAGGGGGGGGGLSEGTSHLEIKNEPSLPS